MDYVVPAGRSRLDIHVRPASRPGAGLYHAGLKPGWTRPVYAGLDVPAEMTLPGESVLT